MDRLKNRLLAANVVGMFVLAYAFMAGPGLAAPGQRLTLANVVTTQVGYQGRLVVADGTYDFIFRLYDAASAGALVGASATVNDAPVKATAYSVALDFGAAAFTGSARWLEVYYRPGASTGGYTKLSPRQPLLATAYAESLRPGATISGNLPSDSAVLRVTNTGAGTALSGSAHNHDTGGLPQSVGQTR
jgi:hypothetical protein